MQPQPPFQKFFKIAFITSPLFGFFGASPGLAFSEFEMKTVLLFLVYITIFALYLWMINILLVKLLKINNGINTQILRYLLSSAICVVTIWFLFKWFPPQMVMHYNLPNHPKMPPVFSSYPPDFMKPKLPLMQMFQGLSVNIIIVVLVELAILKQTKQKVDSENEQLKMFQLEARNKQLKQQLHPHFLFNSLSTLRSLIRRSPERAEEYLEQLSDLLRFSTSNSNQSTISLKEEAELCSNYLAMQQTRFGNGLYFLIDIDTATQQNGKVPVFALQQLSENAIKHNILTKEQPLFIQIFTDPKKEWVIVKNNLQPKETLELSMGVGLANLSERYRLAGADDIIVNKDNDNFSVAIKILYYAGNHN